MEMHTPTSRNWQAPTTYVSTTPTHCCKNRSHPSPVGNQHQLTPVTSRRSEALCTPSTNYVQTPSPICNPFELHYEHLQHAIVTPGVFRQAAEETSEKSESFQWDIEHVALLNPVDFGDVTDKLKRQDRHCRKIDQLAQEAVGKFFEKDQIMPSPWTEPVPKVNLLAMIEEEKSVLPSESKRHACCQTDIHIPMSEDFNEIFKCYRLSDSQIEDLNRGESFSNSSLRRKLFNNDSDCSMSDNSPERLTPSRPSNQESPTMGDWCSSSPVFADRFDKSEYSRRCSVTAMLRQGSHSNSRESSPDLSPITSPIKPTNTSLNDNFQPSNTNETNCNEDDFAGKVTPVDASQNNMSVDMHTSKQFADELAGQKSVLAPVYYMGTESAAAEPLPTSFGQSDTGYQTTSMVSIHMLDDLSRVSTSTRFTDRTNALLTPEKAATPDWEPPVASTPNKNRLFNIM